MIKKRRKLGEILVQKGSLEPERLTQVLRLQKESGKPLGQMLIDHELLTKEELTKALGEQMGIPHVWLRKGLVDPKIVHVLPKDKAIHYHVLPMFVINGVITLATSDPYGFYIFDEVRKITNLEVQPVICRAEDILDAIPQAYQEDASIEDMMSSADESAIDVVEGRSEEEVSELAEMAEGSPVINLTNLVLLRAIRDGASDIHIEPQEDRMRIRVRIDGILYEQRPQKVELHPAVVSRLKVMSKLNIAERRMPQDGRIQVVADGNVVDLRFSSMPGVYGEKVVMRILDRTKAILDLNHLGFEAEILDNVKRLIKSSHGLILACGPTGSGKTTTLYSAIAMLNTPERNIITVEDPVEYQIPNINQNQVNAAIGLKFATFIRHALRQDPDIIMVGEIRDRETAEIAIQSSLTGHLVLSTLHTNDSPSSITRLLEMGIEPYLLSSSLLASLSQRLVRTICPDCKAAYYASASEIKALGVDSNKQLRLYRGEGCSSCYDSGYKGRTGINELLTMEGALQSLILENPTIDVIRQHCQKMGYHGLKEAGYQKVLNHETTIEEVHRVSSLDI
ncbi:MAG: ATPase, T2SS/T4P/T4SS family [Desulfobacterales bacterium]|nr:ATPase, T2SS/T4P/T4SS family [Desulfobacterales bacterium]MDX2512251.1 ATPase, T2SS/T4P/T4SS family [Desulfobacterales bacterium]